MSNGTDRKDRAYLKTRFEAGDRPSQADFSSWLDSSLNMLSDQIYAQDQKIGIGTTTPQAPLEIKGSQKPIKQSFLSSDGSSSQFHIAHPQPGQVALGSGQGQNLHIGTFAPDGSVFSSKLALTDAGYLGIQTDAPDCELVVNGSARISEKLTFGGATLECKDDNILVIIGGKKYRLRLSAEGQGWPGKPIYWALIGAGVVLLALILVAIIIKLGGNG